MFANAPFQFMKVVGPPNPPVLFVFLSLLFFVSKLAKLNVANNVRKGCLQGRVSSKMLARAA